MLPGVVLGGLAGNGPGLRPCNLESVMATGRVKRVVNKGAGARRDKPTQGGAAVVEFAIVLPILLNLLFVAYVLAQGFYKNMVLINAVRLGAQYAAVNSTDVVDKNLVFAEAKLPDMDPEDIKVKVDYRCTDGSTTTKDAVCPSPDTSPRTYVLISADYSYKPGVPYLPETISLSQAAEIRIK